MSKMPDMKTSVHALSASAEAKEVLERILERKQELEDYVAVIQPLLFTISVALYGDDNSDVSLAKLVQDAIALINHNNGVTIQ